MKSKQNNRDYMLQYQVTLSKVIAGIRGFY